MAIFQIRDDDIRTVDRTTFGAEGLKERGDLQRLLRDQIEIVAEDVLVIAEEFGEWTDGRRRIDLLGIDKAGNLVVIELKRTEAGGHMELQALRYAAMVSTLTAARAVEIFERYLADRDKEGDAEALLLEFLEWPELDEDAFGQDVRIVLVSADFSRELTTAVMWLNEKDLDIRCTRIRPYNLDDKTLIDVQQVIPLPEAAAYQVGIRAKRQAERSARTTGRDFRRYDIEIAGKRHTDQWKRNAIWLVVRHLLADDVTPTEIDTALAPVRGAGVWFEVQRETDGPDAFEGAAIQQEQAGGRKFDRKRWRMDAEDVISCGGRSYVFTKMWGAKWEPCLELISTHWPELCLRWWASEEGEGDA